MIEHFKFLQEVFVIYRSLTAPISCQIELTTACQLKCVHCYNHWRCLSCDNDLFMTEKEAEFVANQIIDAKVFQVTLTGGEPLLNRKALFRILDLLKDERIEIGLNSNLISLSEKDVDILHAGNVKSVLTSFASSSESVNDSIMKLDGAQKRIIKGIELVVETGFSVGCSMVVTKMNLDDVVETGLFLQSLGVTNFYATKGSPPLNSKGFDNFMLSGDELLKVMDDLSLLKERHGLEVGILECYPVCFYCFQEKYPFTVGKRCSAGSTACAIGSAGDVRACTHSDVIYGNIFKGGLKEAWGEMRDWRDGARISSTCRTCVYFPECSGGCRVDAEFCGGAKDSMDPYADKNQIASVSLLKKDVLVEFSEEQRFFVKKIKFRKEIDSVLCASLDRVHSPVLLTVDMFDFLVEMSEKTFTLSEMSSIINLDINSCKELCSCLFKDGLLSVL